MDNIVEEIDIDLVAASLILKGLLSIVFQVKENNEESFSYQLEERNCDTT